MYTDQFDIQTTHLLWNNENKRWSTIEWTIAFSPLKALIKDIIIRQPWSKVKVTIQSCHILY